MFGFAVLVDVCLTGTLVTVLLRSRTGFKRCVHEHVAVVLPLIKAISCVQDGLADRSADRLRD